MSSAESVKSDKVDLEDTRDCVTDHFDDRTWDVTEAALAAHATLLIDDQECFGLVVVGPSGSGKTTALKFFEGLSDVYVSDEATPASFVTHDASRETSELEEIDLLPRIRHKTMLTPDMANWFSGATDSIEDKMATLANVMDGDGYTRDSGTHGQRGYDGDYGFNFIGASTPLDKRAWDTMGHTGNRFVFHEMRGDDVETVAQGVFSDESYGDKIDSCSESVHSLVTDLWEEYGGYRGADWDEDDDDVDEDIKDNLMILAQFVQYARAPLRGEIPEREGLYRIAGTMKRLAQGRALLNKRTSIEMSDLQVCGRVALSTMHRERRPLVRALLDPGTDDYLDAATVMQLTGMSRPTALNRLSLMDMLGFGEADREHMDGQRKKILRPHDAISWPEELDFPEF